MKNYRIYICFIVLAVLMLLLYPREGKFQYEYQKARRLFTELASDRADAYGAESAYTLIQEAYDRGDFAEVERQVFAFSDAGSSQVYWLAKSFIVLGDAYADRGDLTQAEATFNSILDGYQPTREDDDVLGQVRSRLDMLKTLKR